MAVIKVLTESTFAQYVQAIRSSPRELIANRKLLLTAALYATSAIPISMSLLITDLGLVADFPIPQRGIKGPHPSYRPSQASTPTLGFLTMRNKSRISYLWST